MKKKKKAKKKKEKTVERRNRHCGMSIDRSTCADLMRLCSLVTCSCHGFTRCILFFFFKQKTAYEIPKRDWSSDVCSSDLGRLFGAEARGVRQPPEHQG